MGLFGDFINHIAGMLGESLRIKRTASKAENMDEETKALFNKIVKAAENGNVKAMVEVGNWYYKGKRIGYDPERVEYWWTRAAKAGDVDSQYNLGLLFHGNISPLSLDEEKAGYWFYKAVQNGDAESKKCLINGMNTIIKKENGQDFLNLTQAIVRIITLIEIIHIIPILNQIAQHINHTSKM
ncbi:MAG: sel1 repeat family protein [Clostridia bacterium]|nr:sel1 repeat family protein [Clostridia bacterium]